MKLPSFFRSLSRSFCLSACAVLGLTAIMSDATGQDANTTVYVDALWQRVHAADCPYVILMDQKATMTLGQADQLGYRIGESGQSGRTDCCLHGYTRQYPAALIGDNHVGVGEQRPDDIIKYHVHGCHRFTPEREDLFQVTRAEVMATTGNYTCEHCIERGPGFAQMTQEEWDKLPSSAPWVPPLGWSPSPFPQNAYLDQGEIDILLSEAQHGSIAIQERIYIDPVATVDNFMIMRFFFPVHRWLELYQAYRVTGDTHILEQLRGSARHYNTLSKNYLSAAQKKAQDPEGMAYMYTMAASAKITLQLAQKYPSEVTTAELTEAEDFLTTIISVLQPTCEGNSNLDSVMGIPQALADDFRSRAFNRALNGIGTIGMTVAALEDLQELNSTTAYQSQIDRYRKVIQEYIINWKNTGWQENVGGKDYFTYPYKASDSGFWQNGVKLFAVDDQGHFSHSMQGCYLLFESVPELGVDQAFMTAIANTVEYNSTNANQSGSPQTPSQEAERPGYSRKPFGAPRDRFYLLNAFNPGVIDGQCSKLSSVAKDSTNSQFDYRLATFNAFYLKELSQDPTLIHLGEDSVAPPAPPTGLAGTGSNGSVSLDWDDSTESDMSGGTYTVYRSTNSGSGYSQIATGLSTSAYVDNAVVNDTLYFYVVTATDTNGDSSSNSGEAFAAPFVADGTPPAAPSGLGAAATDGSVTLSWSNNGETDFNSYNLYRSTSSGSYGTALATGLVASEYTDTDVINGTTYYYVVRAMDHSGNESANSSEIFAVPEAYGPTITFGSNNDGWGGFAPSASTVTEVWSLTADGVNYAFGVPGVGEGHHASLMKSYLVDRSPGSTYTLEGVVDLSAGYGDDNNRVGLLLFNSTPTQTADGGGGLYIRLNADDGKDIAIKNGINGTTLASTSHGVNNGDSWIGQTLKFTADLSFSNVGGTDKLDVTFTLTDGSLNTYTASAQVDADTYPGTYFGFGTKWRQRGDGGSRDAPAAFDYKSFSFIDNNVDTTPPTAPTGLAATAGDDFVSLNWTNSSESDLASYSVYRSNVSGSFTGALATGPFSSSFTDENAVNGTTYYYVITATDADGNESSQSSEVTATPQAPNNDPTFTGATLVKDSVEANQSYGDTVAGDASDPDGDTVSYAKISGPEWLSVASSGVLSGSPALNDVGLNSWTIAATDGNGGSAQATLEITVSADLTLPSAPTGASATVSFSEVSLNWDDNGESDLASYTVYRSTTSGSYGTALVSGLVSSDYIDTSVVNDTTYYYVVTAVDTAANESLQSSEVSGTPTDSTPPTAPTNLAASAGHNVVSLTWDANAESDLASYAVYRSENSGSFGAALISGLSSSTYVDTSAVSGTTYYYLVVAIDSSGNESSESNEVSSTPQAVTGIATMFVGDGVSGAADNYIGTTANWDNGLPVGQQGSITIDARYDSNTTHTAYEVLHTVGEVRRGNGFAGFKLGAGSVWIMDGSGASFAATRGLALTDAQFTLNEGTADFTDNDRDTNVSGASAIMVINGGSISIGRKLDIRSGGQLVVNGGSLTISSSISNPGYSSAAGAIQFNGGTITAQSFTLDNPSTISFGGTAAGSFTLTSTMGTGATLNWLPGTQMTMTAATDEWAAAEWAADRLLYNGQSSNDLGKSWAQVTALDGLEADVRFVYDSVTETLSLEVGGPPADADLDGINDAWEKNHFGDTVAIDGSADTDKDGVSDFFEYLHDSDPTDSSSHGSRLKVGPSGGSMVFEWDVKEGFFLGTDYLVEYCTNLSNPDGWQPLPEADYTLTPNTAGGMTSLDLEITADHGASVFIRLVQP